MNRMKLGPLAKLKDMGQVAEYQTDSLVSDLHFNNSPTSFHSDPSIRDAFSLPGSRTPGSPECSCFIPMHYESNHAYPLVVWLHSTGADQHQIDDVMPAISERNYVGVAVHGTELSGNEADGNGKFGWLQEPEAIEDAINSVQHAIDTASARFNVNSQRIFIAGRGLGGTMAFRVAFEQPTLFAGVASLNGGLPCNLNPLQNWRSCRQVPVFWAHGRKSTGLPETSLCQQVKLLHVAGFDVTLRQYPCDDQLMGQVYPDFNQWMMDQINQSVDSNIIG